MDTANDTVNTTTERNEAAGGSLTGIVDETAAPEGSLNASPAHSLPDSGTLHCTCLLPVRGAPRTSPFIPRSGEQRGSRHLGT